MTEEQRAARLRYHLYETCEGIQEHAERIVDLEELVADLARVCGAMCERMRCDDCVSCAFNDEEHCNSGLKIIERARELGIEVCDA